MRHRDQEHGLKRRRRPAPRCAYGAAFGQDAGLRAMNRGGTS